MKFQLRVGFVLLGSGLVAYACGGGSLLPGPTSGPSPAPTPNYPVVMAAGDISCDSATPTLPCRSKATSDLIVNQRSSSLAVVVLPLGDLQYDSGTLAEFNRNYHTTWGRLNEFAHPAVGNHEYETPAARGYFDYFQTQGVVVGARGEGFYSFNVGDWHFISLNSNCGQIGGCNVGSAQWRWLDADLRLNSSRRCTIAYMHHPYQSTGTSGNNGDLQPLIRLLYENRVEMALAGHDHDYERFHPMTPETVRDDDRGLRLFVVGTGGRDLQDFVRTHPQTAFRTREHFGVLRITMKDQAYDWAWINTQGAVFDPGSGVCF